MPSQSQCPARPRSNLDVSGQRVPGGVNAPKDAGREQTSFLTMLPGCETNACEVPSQKVTRGGDHAVVYGLGYMPSPSRGISRDGEFISAVYWLRHRDCA